MFFGDRFLGCLIAAMGYSPSVITVRVLLFGSERDAIGASCVDVDLADRATARDVLDALAIRHPSIESSLRGARLAVNGRFAPADSIVAAGDECAVIGLVSGG